MIIEVFPVGPFETNVYLLGCPEKKVGIFIDPAPGSRDILLEKAKEYGLQVSEIFLTHSHWDHIGDVAQLKEDLNAQIYVHREDAGNLRDPGSDGLPLLLPIDGAEPDHFFEEGQKLQVGTLEIEVIHTPGHTPGSVSFYLPKEKILISGDTVFKGTIGSLSFPTADRNAMRDSLAKLSKLPPEIRICPGHGPDTSIGEEDWDGLSALVGEHHPDENLEEENKSSNPSMHFRSINPVS